MKRMIIFMSACILLAGCSDNQSKSDSSITTATTTGAASETMPSYDTCADTTCADTTTASETTDVTSTEPEPEESETDSGESEYNIIAEYNGITVSSKGLGFADDCIGIIVLIDNQSDEDIVVQTRDFSINDFMCRAAFSPDVPAGKKKKAYIRVFNDELQKNDIKREEIEDIEFKIHISTKDFETRYESDAIKWHFSH